MSILIIDITERDGEAEFKTLHGEYFTDRKHGPRQISAAEDAVAVIQALAANVLQHVDGYALNEDAPNRQYSITNGDEVWITYTIRELDSFVNNRQVDSIAG